MPILRAISRLLTPFCDSFLTSVACLATVGGLP